MDATAEINILEWTDAKRERALTRHTNPPSGRVIQFCVAGLGALSGSLAYSAGKVYEIAAKVLVVPAATPLVQDLQNFSFDGQNTEEYILELIKLNQIISTDLGDVSKLRSITLFVTFLGLSIEEVEKSLSECGYEQLSKQRQKINRSLFTYLKSLKGVDNDRRIDCERLIRKFI